MDKNINPNMKEPVRSFRSPMRKGPEKPPISPIEKKIPPATPIYLDPTSGISIRMSRRRGIRPPAENPRIRISAMRVRPPLAYKAKRVKLDNMRTRDKVILLDPT